MRLFGLLFSCLTLFSAQVFAQTHLPVTAKQKPVDYSALTALKDALLDLKGAVEVGVSRQDYQRKLQAATSEGLKADERVPDTCPSTIAGASCRALVYRFNCYYAALSKYKLAASEWDILIKHKLFLIQHNFDVDSNDYVPKIEADLQTAWSDAVAELDEAKDH